MGAGDWISGGALSREWKGVPTAGGVGVRLGNRGLDALQVRGCADVP